MQQSFLNEIEIGGSFDKCLTCAYLGAGCAGANTNLMEFERYIEWLRALRELRKSQGRRVSVAQISEATDLSKNTVDNFFAGKNKDVSRTTMRRIERYLIGGNTQSPCAMDLSSPQNYEQDVAEVRAEYQRKIDYLLKELEQKNRIINKLLGM